MGEGEQLNEATQLSLTLTAYEYLFYSAHQEITLYEISKGTSILKFRRIFWMIGREKRIRMARLFFHLNYLVWFAIGSNNSCTN